MAGYSPWISLVLLIWLEQGNPHGALDFDDFENPIEITTSKSSEDLQLGPVLPISPRYRSRPADKPNIKGRTRLTVIQRAALMDVKENKSLEGNMVDAYCCFWLYQKHPAIPEIWEFRMEYGFDFVLNGKFLKNARNYTEPTTEILSHED